ncbi:hypothetical protein RRG08_054693 [Elysia crispata]|uniref:Uncharacterized protein n=1 Tax=Elysia crispata TaxID=231223 RepID=A0AAE1B167_9GAST|nr:hypothetical protein RRG08_054693 [Elysia crispata]
MRIDGWYMLVKSKTALKRVEIRLGEGHHLTGINVKRFHYHQKRSPPFFNLHQVKHSKSMDGTYEIFIFHHQCDRHFTIHETGKSSVGDNLIMKQTPCGFHLSGCPPPPLSLPHHSHHLLKVMAQAVTAGQIPWVEFGTLGYDKNHYRLRRNG